MLTAENTPRTEVYMLLCQVGGAKEGKNV